MKCNVPSARTCARYAIVLSAYILPCWTVGAQAAAVQARPAYTFVNSVGVSTHFGWYGTVYDTRFADLKGLIRELGVRHARDLADNSRTATSLNDLNQTLGLKAAIDIDVRTGSGASQRLNPSGIAARLAMVKSYLSPSAIQVIGSANEPNNLERFYGYTGWAADLRAYQAELYRQVKADPVLRSKPVTASSIAMTETRSFFQAIGNQTATIDRGCAHIYPHWMTPTEKVNEGLPNIQLQSGNEPIYVTETGYHTAKTGWQPISENAKAKNVGRIMAEYLAQPLIDKLYFYQLVDEYPDPTKTHLELQFGLIDNALNRKPAFYAARNMMAVMCDAPLTSAPGSLSYSLSGATQDVRTMLWQKNNGSFYLLMWLQKRTSASGGDVYNAPQTVTLSFGTPVVQARLYKPTDASLNMTVGHLPKATYNSPSSLTLSVRDQVDILEIVPATAPIPPTPQFCSFQPS